MLDAPIELVALRIEAVSLSPRPPLVTLPSAGEVAPVGLAVMRLADGPAEVPVFDRPALGAGTVIDGPAILTRLDTTTVILPGWRAQVHPSGAPLMEVPE